MQLFEQNAGLFHLREIHGKIGKKEQENFNY